MALLGPKKTGLQHYADQIHSRRQKLHHENNMRQAAGTIDELQEENASLRRALKNLQDHYELENAGWTAFAGSVLGSFSSLRKGKKTMQEIDEGFAAHFAKNFAIKVPDPNDRKKIRPYIYGSTQRGDDLIKLIFD